MDLLDVGVVVAAPDAEEALERQRLSSAWDREQERRRVSFEFAVARSIWRRRAEEAARRRGLTSEQRQAEDDEHTRVEAIEGLLGIADMVDALVEDAVRVRDGRVPAARLARYCAELRGEDEDRLDEDMWRRWLRLAGLSVDAGGRVKVGT